METAQELCGMTKSPRRHKETWWWNEDVAEAVREMKKMYGKWWSVLLLVCQVKYYTRLVASFPVQPG